MVFADGDGYALIAQVRKRGKEFPDSVGTDAEVLEMIEEVTSMINVELRVAAVITTEPYATALRKVCIDVVLMMVLEGRHFKENNLMVDVTSYWAITPEFTDRNRRLFSSIREQIEDQTLSYNTITGVEVN